MPSGLILPSSYTDMRGYEPLTPEHAPGNLIVDLFNRRANATPESRWRALVCREVRRNILTVGVPEEWNDNEDIRAIVECIDPRRQSIELDLSNSMGAREAIWSRKAYKSDADTAARQAEEAEVFLNAARKQQFDWPEAIGMGVAMGEYGLIVQPRPSQIEKLPNYMIKDGKVTKPNPMYDRDAKGRSPRDEGYGERSSRASIKAHRDDYRSVAAVQLPVSVELVSMLDCVPVFTRGWGRQRWKLRGLVVRQLMETEELLADGWNWKGMGDRAVIPRGYVSGRSTGQAGAFYLYRAYLTHVEPSGEEIPFVAYTVGGAQTWNTKWSDDEDSHVINFKDEYGICHLPAGYFYGLHHADDDVDWRGMPLLWPLVRLILNSESLRTSYLAHLHDNAFSGYFQVPAEHIPPEAYLEADNTFRKVKVPRSKEVVTSSGIVQPWAQAQVGTGVQYLLADFTQQLVMQSDDPRKNAGESGHAMVVDNELMKTAKNQIPEGSRQASEFAGENIAEQLCGLVRGQWKDAGGKGVEVWIAEDMERTLDDGSVREVTDLIQFKDRWFGSNYAITAKLPKEANLADVAQLQALYKDDLATFEEVREALGDEHPETTFIKIYARKWLVGTPEGQLTIAIEVANLRGMTESAKRHEAALANQLNQLGFPQEAIAPELQGMGQGGGAVPGMQATNPADNIYGGIVAGAKGTASRQNDAMAQMAIGPGQQV